MSDAETNNTVIIYQDEVIAESGGGSGGGGSNVEPNPSGTPTDTLETIGINGTIYEIEGGGGGGAIYREVTLYNAPDRTWRDITLADSLLNYDLVLFHIHDTTYNGSDANHQHEGALVFTKQELIDCYNDTKVLWLMGYDNTYALYTLTDYQTLTANAQVSVFIQRITGVKFGSSQVSPIIYSTEEREVGVWIDNKPLYQKTITITKSGTATYFDLSSLNIDTFVKYDAQNINVNLAYSIGLPYYESNNYWCYLQYDSDNGSSLDVICGNGDYTGYPTVIANIFYTKTTDVAGSAHYTTLGAPAHHYDGNEKVVGTWFGETLYERTFNGLATNTNGDNWVNIGGIDASTWKDVVNVEIYCNSSDVNNKLTRIAPGEARVFNGNVQVTTSVSYNRQITVATIQYTKTS